MMHPWFKFYANHWSGDPHLRLCSLTARGLLIDLMAIAHNGNPYGYVTNGDKALNEQELGRVLSCNWQTVSKALAELELNGRIGRAIGGVIYIPRMVRDGNKTKEYREYGRRGGNPELNLGVNPRDKAEEDKEEEKKKIEDIYQAYPRKTAKPRAIQAISKALKKNRADFLLQKVREYSVATGGMERQYIPHPSTWFNQERFNDDPSEWNPKGKVGGQKTQTYSDEALARGDHLKK